MKEIIGILITGLFWLLVIGFIWQLTRMSLRERLHAFLGPTMLVAGLFFLVGPIHFNKTVERTEKEIKQQFNIVVSQLDQHTAENELTGRQLDRSLDVLIDTAKGMRKNNDTAAYIFFVFGILTVISTPWKFGKVDQGGVINSESLRSST